MSSGIFRLSDLQASIVSSVLTEVPLEEMCNLWLIAEVGQIRFVLQAICQLKACLEWSDMDKQEVFSPRKGEIMKFHIY